VKSNWAEGVRELSMGYSTDLQWRTEKGAEDAKKALDAKDGEIAVLKKQVADAAVTPPNHPILTDRGWVAANRCHRPSPAKGATVGRPQRRRDFHRQYDLNPARCHLITVSGFTIAKKPLA
jgi:hypothetical protein